MNTIKLIIVDDHALIREGLTKILSLEGDIEVVGEAASGSEAVERVASIDADIILMDINMPGMSGVEACKIIKKEKESIGIIALTIHDQEEYLFECIRAGASAYLLKDVSPGQLVDTIRGVARGESFIPPKLMSKVFSEINRLTDTPKTGSRNISDELLTPREKEVLRLVAQGESNRSIAKSLFISEKTVKNHLYRIFQKLEVEDRTQAALYAVKSKLVNL
ncbi:two component transcriptional regulator [Desulfocucumis palustris]|uniref:Stage 0 sporulation protein A homolog n=1 Tax=Desulfocucumis palustris TaxID=1898651 RepID=A0A2L2X978_9FIRM|nr:response regulator transcription factor [Desulfocucumis palustris]GBF32580.1 two component transcriptional regulator [Desulfocucumis palustris]